MLFTFNTATLSEQKTHYDQNIHAVVKAYHSATISNETAGAIKKIHIKEGTKFKTKDMLINLGCEENKFKESLAIEDEKEARLKLESNRKLNASNALSDLEYQLSKTFLKSAQIELERAKHQSSLCNILAPFSGTVAKIHVQEHQYVKQGNPLIDIFNNKELYVSMLVPSDHFENIFLGKKLVIHLSELKTNFSGKIERIIPKIDSISKSFEVHASIDNSDAAIWPGMSGFVSFQQELTN